MRRRAFITLVTASGAGAVLAACGSGADGSSSATASSGSSASASGAGFPATVQTEFGAVTVDSAPQRVVALGWGDAETALALGVQPVGASDWLGFGGEGVGPWAQGLYTTAPTIIETLEPSFEKIAALQPDLILDTRGSGDADRYAKLKSIATTVGIPPGGASYATTTNQQLELVSTALGKQAEGQQLLSDLEKAFADAAAAHPQWKGRTATVATKTSEGWGAYISRSGDGSTDIGSRVAFVEALGFTQNPQVAALPVSGNGFSVDISSEQLDLLDANVVIAFPIFIPTTDITGDAAWNAVPAVAAGHAVVLDSGPVSNAFSLGTTLATQYALQQLVPQLERVSP